MASTDLPKISNLDRIALKSAQKKLGFGPRDIPALREAQAAGVSNEQALANLAGVPDGEEPKGYIKSKLNSHEYSVLQRVLSHAVDGSPLDD